MTFGFSFRVLVALVLVALAGVLQATDLLVVGGAKLNLPLSALIASAFLVPTLTWYLVLIIIAGFFVRFAPGIDVALLSFMAISLAAFAARRFFLAIPAFGVPFITLIATPLLYLLIDVTFLQSFPLTVLAETFYNTVVAVACYGSVVFFIHDRPIRFSL